MSKASSPLPLVFAATLLAALHIYQPEAALAQSKIYKIRRADGSWAFSDNPDGVGGDSRKLQVEEVASTSELPRNLERMLERALKPRNAIERAALAVVTVHSPLGLGTGFFITKSGYLVTNRHVLERSRGEKRKRDTYVRKVAGRVRELERRLAAEQQRLTARQQALARYRVATPPEVYSQRLGELREWQSNLNRRKRELRAAVQEFATMAEKDSQSARLSSLAPQFEIVLANGAKLQARRVAVDNKHDLALLVLDGYTTPSLERAPPRATAVGDKLFAIGNPAALHQSVAQGVLSGYEGGYVKTDAKIYPGNSGGPLVTEDGKVVGINTFKKLTYKFEGLGFAIPIEQAFESFADRLHQTPPKSSRSPKRDDGA